MKPNDINFDSFTMYSRVWELPLGDNLLRYKALQIQKVDEDPDKGYCYGIWLVTATGDLVQVGLGWFDGFGCEDRPNDVIHFVRAYVRAFVPERTTP
jgi:hypothetical protein